MLEVLEVSKTFCSLFIYFLGRLDTDARWQKVLSVLLRVGLGTIYSIRFYGLIPLEG